MAKRYRRETLLKLLVIVPKLPYNEYV